MDKLAREIEKLLARAEPLRKLPDGHPEKDALTGIVDRINELRAEQAKDGGKAGDAEAWSAMAGGKNARVEGDDA